MSPNPEYEYGMRIAQLEQQVAALYQHLGVAAPRPGSGISPEVLAELQRGNKIGAIKIHREQTGVGLAEAKAAIEGHGH